jgi:hypothetical protein
MVQLSGLTFYTSCLVLDLAARSVVRTISNTVTTRVL